MAELSYQIRLCVPNALAAARLAASVPRAQFYPARRAGSEFEVVVEVSDISDFAMLRRFAARTPGPLPHVRVFVVARADSELIGLPMEVVEFVAAVRATLDISLTSAFSG